MPRLVIYKYELRDKMVELAMPVGATVLDVQVQRGL